MRPLFLAMLVKTDEYWMMATLFDYIDQINAHPDAKTRLEAEIWQHFGCHKTVLALDMSGFSLTVRRDGIVSYLARIRQMQHITMPLVGKFDGELVKCEADNLMAVFDNCNQAVLAAIAMSTGCQQMGQTVSIGLDYGRILLMKHQDCYGDAVNKAYKLGEDIARANEILLSDSVKTRLADDKPYRLQSQHISVSGLEFEAWQVIF